MLIAFTQLWLIYKERRRGIEYAFCVIFTLALLEVMAYALHWIYFGYAQLHFVGLYLSINMVRFPASHLSFNM